LASNLSLDEPNEWISKFHYCPSPKRLYFVLLSGIFWRLLWSGEIGIWFQALESVEEALVRLEKLLQELHVSSSSSGKEHLKAACSDLEKMRKLKKEAEFLEASFRAKAASLRQVFLHVLIFYLRLARPHKMLTRNDCTSHLNFSLSWRTWNVMGIAFSLFKTNKFLSKHDLIMCYIMHFLCILLLFITKRSVDIENH